MKRTIIAAGALALAGGIFFMPNALATHTPDPPPSTACDAGEVPGVVEQTENSLTVCITQGPVTGNATASGDSANPAGGGYVVADGDPSNATPSDAMGGYIGVESSGGAPTVVSSGCDANYDQSDTGDEFTAEGFIAFIQAGGTSQCDPHTGEPLP